MSSAVAILILLATTLPARAASISDSEALAIVQKHCMMCHAPKPVHKSFQEAPKDVTLETLLK